MSPVKRTKKHPTPSAKGGFPAMLKHAAIGAGIAIALSLVLCLGGSALCLLWKDPATLARPVGMIVLYLSALAGGVISAHLHKKELLPCGILCGIMIAVFFWFLTLFFGNDGSHTPFLLSLLLRLLTVGASTLGALIPLKLNAPRRRRRRS